MSKKIKESSAKSNHNDREYESRLSFYSINLEGIADMHYEDVWDNHIAPLYILNNFNISCRQIVGFKLPVSSLSQLLRDGIANELLNILDIIKNELENDGANFMFVQPMNGKPINGYYIEKFINQSV